MPSSTLSRLAHVALAASLAASGAIVATAVTTTAAHAATSAVTAASSSIDGKITRSEVIQRAQYWLGKSIPYNQGGSYPDSSGRNYRTDCSGYVSMAWHLGAGTGPDTRAIEDSYTYGIQRSELKAGDVLNSYYNHVLLFEKWDDAAHTTFSYYSFGSTPVKHVTGASINGTLDSHPNSEYKALRYKNIVDDVQTRATKAGVYHPSTQTFYEGDNTGSTLGSAKFGNAGWTPLVGDWNGDGVASVGAYDPATATFYLSNDNSTAAGTAKFGNPGWIPLVGDWNGDGVTSVGAYDPATATFYLSNDNNTAAVTTTFGNPGWIPLVGDWNKDGKDSIGAYDPTTQTFYESNDNSTVAGSVKFGNAGWTPLVGDWNNDGVTSIGAYDPSTQTFYLSNDNSTTAASFVYGSPGDVPIAGRW
ncbi:VCBS repeat-containing protein [Kitasatospora sp. NPDC058397]|uniref:VCBS repeat-containing protein n=1 Tax=unclassified Kitasatospora TaxID=2633591 RepID=UPI003661BDDB